LRIRLITSRDSLIQFGIEAIYNHCIRIVQEFSYPECGIFVCTDSQEFRDIFRDRYAKTIYRDSELLGEMQGPIHSKNFGCLKGAEDAVIEMWLLSDVCGLIYNPSWFSHYARIMGAFDLPPINIDGQSKYGTVDLYHGKR
jgi:hypothetical protein